MDAIALLYNKQRKKSVVNPLKTKVVYGPHSVSIYVEGKGYSYEDILNQYSLFNLLAQAILDHDERIDNIPRSFRDLTPI